MDEYIKRASAIKAFNDPVWKAWSKGVPIEKIIQGIPCADVAPVRHGRWQTHLGWGWVWRCSCCEYKMWKKEFFKIKRNYCPNCGAQMDGKETEE